MFTSDCKIQEYCIWKIATGRYLLCINQVINFKWFIVLFVHKANILDYTRPSDSAA